MTWARLCAVSLLLVATPVHAEPSAADRALAEQLFQEGRQLLEAGRAAQACPKLEESQRLDPGGGTLMNVALCHKAIGKTASAWVEYTEARAQALREGREVRVAEADDQIRALEPTLSRLTIVVAPETLALPDLVIKRGGVPVSRAAIDSMIVDPGTYQIEASAAGKQPYAIEVTVGGDGDRRTVTIPALLAMVEPPRRDVPPLVVARAPVPVLRFVGITAAGLGFGSLTAGAIAGILALSKQAEADGICPTIRCTDYDAVSASYQASTAAIVADVTLPAGAGLVLVGALLYFLTPDEPVPAAVTLLSPWLGPEHSGLSVSVPF